MKHTLQSIRRVVAGRSGRSAQFGAAAPLARRQPANGRPAFSLIELIVVIGIIVIVGAITYPLLAGLTRGSRAEAGLNTVNTALAAARTASTQSKPSMDPPVPGARFSGAAVIFTPASEMRLVEHNQLAVNGAGNYLALQNEHGYADIANRPYITLPTGSAVVGIARNGSGLLLLAPPFAIRFNEYGNLIAGVNTDRAVYYDSNGNGQYVGSSRPNGYSADTWDPLLNSVGKDSQGRYLMQFEQIESVIGVIVYDRNAFREKGFNLTAPAGSGGLDTSAGGAGDWLLKNGKALLVDRYSGSLLRQ